MAPFFSPQKIVVEAAEIQGYPGEIGKAYGNLELEGSATCWVWVNHQVPTKKIQLGSIMISPSKMVEP
jgi:hypothetical protein